MDLLRFATAGSVDDGKSTLIGRLLLDSKAIFEDQLEAVEATSQPAATTTPTSRCSPTACAPSASRASPSTSPTATSRRRRGSSSSPTPPATCSTRATWSPAPRTADLGLVLVDARQGLTEQSRRHAVILSACCGSPTSSSRSTRWTSSTTTRRSTRTIHEEFTSFATKLSIPDLEVIPISALQGDNVVHRSENMPWYDGPSLMHHLEHVHVASDRDLVDARFPVQYVIRPKSDDFHDYRGYGGRVAGGVLKKGDEVLVLPSGMSSKIAGIDLFDREIDEAFPPMSVTIRLEDDVDVSRGDMICRIQNAPKPSQDIDAMVCWMTNEPLRPRQKLAIKHTTRLGGPSSRTSSTASTSTPSTATRRPRSSVSTRSAESSSAPPSRSSATPTRRTAPPAPSSSSTRPPASPSAPA